MRLIHAICLRYCVLIAIWNTCEAGRHKYDINEEIIKSWERFHKDAKNMEKGVAVTTKSRARDGNSRRSMPKPPTTDTGGYAKIYKESHIQNAQQNEPSLPSAESTKQNVEKRVPSIQTPSSVKGNSASSKKNTNEHLNSSKKSAQQNEQYKASSKKSSVKESVRPSISSTSSKKNTQNTPNKSVLPSNESTQQNVQQKILPYHLRNIPSSLLPKKSSKKYDPNAYQFEDTGEDIVYVPKPKRYEKKDPSQKSKRWDSQVYPREETGEQIVYIPKPKRHTDEQKKLRSDLHHSQRKARESTREGNKENAVPTNNKISNSIRSKKNNSGRLEPSAKDTLPAKRNTELESKNLDKEYPDSEQPIPREDIKFDEISLSDNGPSISSNAQFTSSSNNNASKYGAVPSSVGSTPSVKYATPQQEGGSVESTLKSEVAPSLKYKHDEKKQKNSSKVSTNKSELDKDNKSITPYNMQGARNHGEPDPIDYLNQLLKIYDQSLFMEDDMLLLQAGRGPKELIRFMKGDIFKEDDGSHITSDVQQTEEMYRKHRLKMRNWVHNSVRFLNYRVSFPKYDPRNVCRLLATARQLRERSAVAILDKDTLDEFYERYPEHLLRPVVLRRIAQPSPFDEVVTACLIEIEIMNDAGALETHRTKFFFAAGIAPGYFFIFLEDYDIDRHRLINPFPKYLRRVHPILPVSHIRMRRGSFLKMYGEVPNKKKNNNN